MIQPIQHSFKVIWTTSESWMINRWVNVHELMFGIRFLTRVPWFTSMSKWLVAIWDNILWWLVMELHGRWRLQLWSGFDNMSLVGLTFQKTRFFCWIKGCAHVLRPLYRIEESLCLSTTSTSEITSILVNEVPKSDSETFERPQAVYMAHLLDENGANS